MNAFNRIVTIIILFILLALLLALAISPLDVVHWMQEHLANFSAWLARLQATDPINFNIGRAAVAVAALLVLLPLILAEFTREGEAVVRLRTPEGDAQVTTDSITRLEKHRVWRKSKRIAGTFANSTGDSIQLSVKDGKALCELYQST